MFIKVTILVPPLPKDLPLAMRQRRTERYINTDHVVSVNHHNGEILLASQHKIIITPDSAAYLLTCVEAQAALATQEPAPPSIKTRIAQALRWEFPNGTTLEDLMKVDTLDDVDTDAALRALAELFEEKVVKRSLIEPIIYTHASNFITPNPDPSNEGEG